MNSDFLAQIEYLGQERGINSAILLDVVEKALSSAARKSFPSGSGVEVKINSKTGDIKVISKFLVVEKNAGLNQVSLEDAQKMDPEAQPGSTVMMEVKLKNFGRIAAQTARQAIHQHLRKAEKTIAQEEFNDKIGQIVSGIVRRYEPGCIVVDLQKAEGVLYKKDQIPGERYVNGDRISALLCSVDPGGSGPSLVLTRSHADFVMRLFEREVSEIHDGIVTIKAISREPGARTKIAVASSDSRIDPIGACVGMRGMRVKNITNELSGEKIDIVKYDDDIRTFALNAFQPAALKGMDVNNTDKIITVKITQDQSPFFYARSGQNVRLVSKLIGWKVNVSLLKEEMSFEEKLVQTIDSLAKTLEIDKDIADKLVKAGFLTIDGLKAAEESDLKRIDGLDDESIRIITGALEKRPINN